MSVSRIEAMKIYEDYHCRGNSMHTSIEKMAEIVHQYQDELPTWQANISEHDEIVYKFDDDEFLNYKDEGKKKAKDATGYNDNAWDKTKQYGGVIADGTLSVGSVVAKEALKEAGGKVVEEVATKSAEKAGKKITEEAAKEGTKQATKAAGFIIGCTLGAATAALYWAKRTNKDQVEASAEVVNVMNEGMSELNSTQTEMQYMSQELQEAAEEAEKANEEANQQILELKTDFDDSRKAREDIKTKADSGKKLTADDKRRYKEYGSDMADAGESITEISDEASTVVSGIQSDMLTYQEGFNAAAETMGRINGVTEYAAGFDSSTEVLCYVEAGAQTLNVTSTGYSTVQAGIFAASGSWAFGATAWAWAFVALGLAGVAGSGAAAAEQVKWAKEVHSEIDVRTATEELNTNTLDMYNVEVDNYDIALDDVAGLELNMPEDITVDDTELKIPDDNKKETKTTKN